MLLIFPPFYHYSTLYVCVRVFSIVMVPGMRVTRVFGDEHESKIWLELRVGIAFAYHSCSPRVHDFTCARAAVAAALSEYLGM